MILFLKIKKNLIKKNELKRPYKVEYFFKYNFVK